jgi:spoIIIJ-associated protein
LVTEERPKSSEPDGFSIEEESRAAEEFCHELLELAGLDVTVSSSFEDRIIHVNVSGPDRPYLLSNTAAVLNSLEYLANKAFRTGRDEPIASITLDSENYRQHRESELVLLAEMASKKVLNQRRPLNLQPMTPRERRIVHLALASVAGVRSESAGEGDNRCITIFPA